MDDNPEKTASLEEIRAMKDNGETWPSVTPTITKEEFKKATGYDPENDDLERVNCSEAGKVGHLCCGWNYTKNMPVFLVGTENKDEF